MADEEKPPEMPATGGSWSRDPRTGALTLEETPTLPAPAGAFFTSTAAPDEPAVDTQAQAEVPPSRGTKTKET